jgi:4-amino-4-deoxy-L-arabinose transferase-like glycosyltransferase
MLGFFSFELSLSLLLIFVVLRAIFWLTTFPNPDEAYYWLWGQHLDFSYYDHPPFQAWVQGLFTALFGKSFLVLRFPNLISNLLFFYVYYQIIQYLYGDRGRHFFGSLVLLIFASPLYFLFLALAWHDHFLILFSLIASFLLIQFLDGYLNHSEKDWQLYASAATLGLAFLCKYNAVFIALGLVGAVVSDRRLRPLVRDRRFYMAALITASFFLPILIWNINNDFQSFRYYLTRSVDAASNKGLHLKLDQPLVFGLVSILTLSPVNSWAIVKVLRQRVEFQRRTVYRSVAIWIFAISTGGLGAIGLFSTALYYWNIVAYLLLFPLLPAGFETASRKGTLFYVGQCYGLLFAVLLVIHYCVLPLSAFGNAADDPDSQMLYGWREVASAVQRQQTLGAESPFDRPFLVTTDYRSASALAYELSDPTVFAISDRLDQFDFWANPAQLQGKNAIILADDWHPATPKLLNQFEQTSAPVVVRVTRFGVWIKNYQLIKGYRFRSNPQQSQSFGDAFAG